MLQVLSTPRNAQRSVAVAVGSSFFCGFERLLLAVADHDASCSFLIAGSLAAHASGDVVREHCCC